jgi:hypothetical protein
MQLIFGLFCIVFGGTIIFMKKSSYIDFLVPGNWDKYRRNQSYFNKYIGFIRIVGAILMLLGAYVLGVFLYYFWYGA